MLPVNQLIFIGSTMEELATQITEVCCTFSLPRRLLTPAKLLFTVDVERKRGTSPLNCLLHSTRVSGWVPNTRFQMLPLPTWSFYPILTILRKHQQLNTSRWRISSACKIYVPQIYNKTAPTHDLSISDWCHKCFGLAYVNRTSDVLPSFVRQGTR